jgi:hypothetical protein
MKPEATHHMIVDFGRHKGQPWTRLPVGYLKYLVNADTQYRAIAEAELKRRGTTLEYTLEISGHAIDRASLRCRRQWLQTREREEGLHAWLHRLASEALKTATDENERVVFQGLKFVFAYGEIYPTLVSVMPVDV